MINNHIETIGSTIKSVRVKDIILDESHNLYLNAESIGTIYYKEIMGDSANLPVIHIPSLPRAKPLFSFVKNYPLKDEIVLIIESQGSENVVADQIYYFPTLNILGHNHHNSFPYHLLNPKKPLENYKEAVNGLIKSTKDFEEPEINLGEYFKEKSTIRPLRPYEGDIILEGRFGNSIRFGSTVDESKTFRLNKWSGEGEIGDPITIIRNGQGTAGDIGYVHTIEDIDLDDSSIYLTSNQQLTDFIPSSTHFKSWGANLEKRKSILNPVLDKQIEPEIVEQPLAEVEEPVIVEPVIPPLEEIEEEINEKTFEDSSNITEYYTDTNRITPSTTSYINKGTLNAKWISENQDPETEEFTEVTDGLDHFIGANFTLKQLISSNAAAKPEFDIHEEAELERVGVFFHSTGESPTGPVEGHYIKDILGFYAVDGGFMNNITIKDSDMNIIHETEGSLSGNLQSDLEFAESAIFNNDYLNYNMPNPGINNYPGIDSDIISGDEIVSNLKKVMENCIDKIFTKFDNLEIISAYRSVEVSTSVDDSPSLDHVKGYAVDFNVPGASTSEIFNWCFENLEEWKDLMWAYPERGRDSWIHISYEEGKNEKHTTLATDIDSMHEWYESDRRGSSQQYQDGILEANQEIVIENTSNPTPPPPPPPPDVKNILNNESFTVLSGILNGNDIAGQEVRVNHSIGGSSENHHEIKFTLRDPSSPTSPITIGAPPIKIEEDNFPRLTYVMLNSIITGATDLADSLNDGAQLLKFAVSFDESTINDKLSSEATTPK